MISLNSSSYSDVAASLPLTRLTSSTVERRVIDAQPRKGAEGLNIAFLHPKTTCGALLELCENPNK